MSTKSNQYAQIFKTYWQRPLIVLFALLLLPIVLLLAMGKTDGNVMQIGPRLHAPSRIERVYTDSKNVKHDDKKNIQTLSELLERVDPEEVTALNMMQLRDDDRLPDLSPFENLVYLELDSFELTDANVDQICDLPKLDALVYTGTRLPQGAIKHLGQKVSQLKLLALTLEAHPDEIPRMSKVKILALYLTNASPDLLNYVVEIPHLQQLTLINSNLVEFSRRYPSKPQAWEYIDLNEQQIALLRNHSTLKEVYADWFYMQHHGKFDEGAFQPVRALPITYSINKLKAIDWIMFAMALLFSLLSTQIWGHFISPAAKVVPNYLVLHRRVAVAIFLVVVLILWLILLRYEFGILPSLSLILFLPAICCQFSVAILSGNRFQQWLMVPAIYFIFLLLLNLSKLVFHNFASTAIWFLSGQMPIPTLIIIVIEFIFITWSLTKLSAITALVNETYSNTPAFSPWDPKRAKQIQWKTMNKSFLGFIDRGTTGLKYCGGSTWQMVHLWRQGNSFRPMMTLIIFLGVIFFGLVFHGIRCLITGQELIPKNPGSFEVVFAAPMGFAIILPAVIWWQRRKSLDVESMRPISRHKIVKQLYLSLALDHWVVVICMIGINIPGLFEALNGKTEALGFLLFGIAGLLWMIGISSTVLVFKRSWVIVLNMFVLSLLPIAVLAPVAILNSDNPPDGVQDVQLLIQIACMSIVAAIGLNVVMYRVFLKREWG